MSDQAQRPPALIDTRIIEFAQASIRAALESVGVKMLGLPPGSKVQRLMLDPLANCVRANYGADAHERTIEEGRLAAMMIAYCIAARIPISRTADKRIKVTETGITLSFITKLALAPRP